MAPSGGDQDGKGARLERIRNIVKEDFERVSRAQEPHDILNVSSSDSLSQIEERYQRYERFYRAENFQRLGDIDLTRKALDIRRAIGRAIGKVREQRQKRSGSRHSASESYDMGLFTPDGDRQALAAIYLRDGITYLQLGDLNGASRFLRRSVHYDQTEGLALAYLGYVVHKRRSYEPQAVEEARDLLDRAASASPDEPDVFALRGRFFAKNLEVEPLQRTIEHIEQLDPTHPMLDRLQRKLHDMLD